MQQESENAQVIDLTKEIESGVKFDPEAVSLYGIYKDELSLFRAKKSWTEILEANFLLEPKFDYTLQKITKAEECSFVLQCSFLTACGRYAFWRLTNDQAPEAQYLIETAHIPNCDFAADMFISAPDMSPIFTRSDAEVTADTMDDSVNRSVKIIEEIKSLIKKIGKTLKNP